MTRGNEPSNKIDTLLRQLQQKRKDYVVVIMQAVQTFTEEADIKEFVRRLVDQVHEELPDKPREYIEAMQLSNIGYFFGYMSASDRPQIEKWMETLKIVHPIWGDTVLTPMREGDAEEAYGTGKMLGESLRGEGESEGKKRKRRK